MPLTDIKIRQAKAPDKARKLTDGGGLYLEVKPNGSKLWRYRYEMAGKENTFALGEYPTLSLQDARKARDDARELVKQGTHPSHARAEARVSQINHNAVTFELVAQEWLEKKGQEGWSASQGTMARTALEQNVFPKIGRLPIKHIKPLQILDILQTMEKRGAEVYANKVRGWCSAIFCYAVMTLRADMDPVAPLKGAIRKPPVKHCRPMLKDQIGDLKFRLTQYNGHPRTLLAIQLLLYTFVRTTELREATWSEFNLDKGEWIIPPERMKKRRAHLVPLVPQTLALLQEVRKHCGESGFLFPNLYREGCMSKSTVNKALEHMGYGPSVWTGHDFRATASTQLYEMGYREEVVEMQLAHVEGNQTKGAYNHARYLQERYDMMQHWADWIDAIPAQLLGTAPTLPGDSAEPASGSSPGSRTPASRKAFPA